MKKLLLGGILVSSMFTTTANAELKAHGPKSISGWGCAAAEGGVVKEVTLGPDVGIDHHKEGIIKAGDKITREVTFKYDFSKAVECGKKHVFIHLHSKNVKEDGVELVGPKQRHMKFNLSHGKSGHKTVKIEYVVKSPDAWKLTSQFHYKHVFTMTASVH